jgi:hypothetical protein
MAPLAVGPSAEFAAALAERRLLIRGCEALSLEEPPHLLRSLLLRLAWPMRSEQTPGALARFSRRRHNLLGILPPRPPPVQGNAIVSASQSASGQ